MASLYKRGQAYSIRYYVGGKRRERSLRTDSLQVTKDEKRQFESVQLRGEPDVPRDLELDAGYGRCDAQRHPA